MKVNLNQLYVRKLALANVRQGGRPKGTRQVTVMFLISLFTWSNKSGFFEGPTFFHPIRAFRKRFKLLWSAG